MIGRKKKDTSVASWDLGDDPSWSEGPTAAAVVARKPRWWDRFVKTLVYIGLFSVPLSLLVLMMSVTLMTRVAKIPDTPTGNQLQSSPGQAVARAALEDWLAQTPAPLPHATVLAWTGSQTVNPVALANGVKANPVGFTSEIDTFAVSAGGVTYTAGVQVLIDNRGGAVAQGTPALMANPLPANDAWKDGAPWPGLQAGGNIPAPVDKAVGNWAAAYTSGDPGTLQNSVGDANTGHTYSPLPGVLEVRAATTRGAYTSVGSKATMIVQVEMTFRYAGQPPLSTLGSAKAKSVSTMDVLVERADGAAPIVTAWGPSGSGPTLVRYGNAVSAAGRTNLTPITGPSVTSSPSASATSSTTASSNPSPSPSQTTLSVPTSSAAVTR